VVVLEQEELDVMVEANRRLDVRTVVRMRARLRTKHAGHFGSTSRERGKFRLTAAEMLSVVAKLGALGMLNCLQLLHFRQRQQAAQIYCELKHLGAAMRVVDVDYDDTRSVGTDMSVAHSAGIINYHLIIIITCCLPNFDQNID
jgi:arginine decarboxylase